MKALVISESQDVLDSYADFFKSMGYENLCYRWLLKAMDNLEEIQPELIFINASDYPRHWKTLVQHVRASGFCNPVFILASDHLNDDEQAKARFLGIYCITSPIDDEKTRSLIRQQLGFGKTAEVQAAEVPAEEVPASEAELEEAIQPEGAIEADVQPDFEAAEEKVEIEIVDIGEPPEADTVVQEETVPVEFEEIAVEESAAEAEFTQDVQPEAAESETESENIFIEEQPASQEPCETFTFVHPTSKIEISGSLLEYNPPLLSFRPYDEKLFKKLRFAQKAKGIVCHGGETFDVSVQLQGLDEGVAEVCILKSS